MNKLFSHSAIVIACAGFGLLVATTGCGDLLSGVDTEDDEIEEGEVCCAERPSGISIKNEEECAPENTVPDSVCVGDQSEKVCCSLSDGDVYERLPSDTCSQVEGEAVSDDQCGPAEGEDDGTEEEPTEDEDTEEVQDEERATLCCKFPEEPPVRVEALVCDSDGGEPVEAEQCNQNEESEDNEPEFPSDKVCCVFGEEEGMNAPVDSEEECAEENGEVADIEVCYDTGSSDNNDENDSSSEDVCCVLPEGENSFVSSTEICTEENGEPADTSMCDGGDDSSTEEVCCVFPEADNTFVSSQEACMEDNGEPGDASMCESGDGSSTEEVCCVFPEADNVFVSSDEECTTDNGEVAEASMCESDGSDDGSGDDSSTDVCVPEGNVCCETESGEFAVTEEGSCETEGESGFVGSVVDNDFCCPN